MRRVNQSVTAPLKFRAQIIFHLRPDRAALRMPEHEALSVVFLNRKQIEFAAESSMVTLLSFLTLFQPTVEFSLSEERRAVDALHLRTLSIAFPVSAGQRQKLESFQAIRVRYVRTKTEIDERRTIDVIDADVSPSLLVDQLAFQRFITFIEAAQRFRLRNLIAAIRHVALGDVAHLLFNDGKISFRQSARRNHVIEESVAWILEQRRADA